MARIRMVKEWEINGFLYAKGHRRDDGVILKRRYCCNILCHQI